MRIAKSTRTALIIVLLLLLCSVALVIVDSLYRASPTAAPVVVQKAPGIVYELRFDSKPGLEWSSRHTMWTPDRKRKLFGPFLETPVTLSVDGLPAHEFMRVQFELLT